MNKKDLEKLKDEVFEKFMRENCASHESYTAAYRVYVVHGGNKPCEACLEFNPTTKYRENLDANLCKECSQDMQFDLELETDRAIAKWEEENSQFGVGA